MSREHLQAIINSDASPSQKAAAEKLLAADAPVSIQSDDGYTKLFGAQHIYPSEIKHFSITVESDYANDLLKTHSMDAAAKQAANDRLLLGIQAKYDADTEKLFHKRFKDGYKSYQVTRVD
jgi:hypothetical protein